MDQPFKDSLTGWPGKEVRDGLCDLDQPAGCFLVNASAELGLRQDAVGRALRDSLAVVEGALHETLTRAQAQGLIAPGRDLRALARFFLATSRSMALMYRATGDRTFIEDIARCALELLDVPGGPPRPGVSR